MGHSYLEERYCIHCKQNVGVEYTRTADGEIIKRCLTRACGERDGAKNCFFNTHSSE